MSTRATFGGSAGIASRAASPLGYVARHCNRSVRPSKVASPSRVPWLSSTMETVIILWDARFILGHSGAVIPYDERRGRSPGCRPGKDQRYPRAAARFPLDITAPANLLHPLAHVSQTVRS